MNYVGLKTRSAASPAISSSSWPAGRRVRGRELRVTPLQNVLLPHVSDARARRAARRAAAARAPVQPLRGAPRRRLVHGHGLLQPGPDRHQDARDGAHPRALEGRLGKTRPIAVRWSGCPGRRAASTSPPTSGSRAQGEGRRQDRRRRPRVRGRARRPRPARRHADPEGRATATSCPRCWTGWSGSSARGAEGGARREPRCRGCRFFESRYGDAELVALKALRRLREANVVIHDRLVHPEAGRRITGREPRSSTPARPRGVTS